MLINYELDQTASKPSSRCLHLERVVVCIPPTASSHSTAPLRPAILPAERANFDQLYIIQQGGRGITREQIIAQLE